MAAGQLTADSWERFMTIRGPKLTHFATATSLSVRVHHAIAAHCPQLRVLKLDWQFIKEEVVLSIAQSCRLVESVDFRSNPYMPESAIRAFSQPGKLRELCFSAVQCSPEAVVEAIQCSPHLRKLAMSMVDMETSLTAIAAHCAGLGELELQWYEAVGDVTSMNAKLGAIAQSCPRLRTLRFNHIGVGVSPCPVRDATIAQFALHCPLLTSVYLVGLRELTDVSVTALAHGCRWLRTLQVTSVGVTIEGMRAVAAHCCHIREVQLRNQVLVQQVQSRKLFQKRVLVSKCD
jgi:hypothetical protein